MNSSWLRLVLVTGLALSIQAQTNSNPPSTNTISPPQAPLDRPPSPPDAPLPDLGSLPSPANPTKSKVKRALDRLTPNCADVVYHSCWSSPAQDPSARLPEAEREAVFRLAREAGALDVRPLFPEATDEELASLQMIDVDSDAAIPKLMKALAAHKAVEFVEPEVKRKLKFR